MKEYGFESKDAFSFDAWVGLGYAKDVGAIIDYLSSGGVFTFSTDSNSNDTIHNYGTGQNGSAYSSNHLYMDGATHSVTYDTTGATYEYAFIVSTKSFTTVTSPLTVSHSQYFTTTSALTTNEINQLNANPDLLNKVWFDSYVLVDGFAKADMVKYYRGDDVDSGQYVQDLSVALENDISSVIQFGTSTVGNSVSIAGESITYINTVAENVNYEPMVITQHSSVDYTQLYHCIYTINVTSGTAYAREWSGGNGVDGTTTLTTIYKVLPVGTYTFSAMLYLRDLSGGSIGFELDGLNYPTFEADATLTVRKVSATEVANYTSNVRTNFANTNYGVPLLPITQDATGRALSYDDTTMHFDNSIKIDTETNLSTYSTFTINETIDGAVYIHEYDGANLTTTIDTVPQTPVAHTPENANYIMGKGVYPKVTADPFTDYVQTQFTLEGN